MNPFDLVADGTLWVALPLALAAGLLSFLSPCVLPLVPGYLGFIAGAVAPRPAGADGAVGADAAAEGSSKVQGVSSRSFLARSTAGEELVARSTGGAGLVARSTAGEDAGAEGSSTVQGVSSRSFLARSTGGEGRAEPADDVEPGRGRLLLGVLLFIAGFTVVFMAVVILGGTLGQFFLAYSDVITRILGAVVIALGLIFIGVFGLAQRTVRPQVRSNVGLIGAPLLGVALGIGWTPCIGPTLGAIISVSWNLGDPGRAALLGLAYSLGLGIPFILITLGFGWATRSITFLRRHIRAVNIIGGVMLIILGLLMVTGVWTMWMSQLQGVVAGVPLPL